MAPTPSEPDSDCVLRADNVSKEFRGFVAVQDVSLRVKTGTIHALIGPNGAGKTTLFNLLTGFLPLTRGRIALQGEDITGQSPARIARRGLVRSFQVSATFPGMTALENVRVALQRPLGTSFHFWRSERSLRALHDRARELLAWVDLQDAADTLASQLPYGRKRALELATTLALEPRVLLLDEPTQGLGHEDVSRISALIRRVAAGRTVLMVEHNLSVVAQLSDVITVLQRGSVLAQGSYDTVSRDPAVREAYIGVEA